MLKGFWGKIFVLQIPRSHFSKSWLCQAAAGWIKLVRDTRGMATTAKDWMKHFRNYFFPMETEKFNFMISFLLSYDLVERVFVMQNMLFCLLYAWMVVNFSLFSVVCFASARTSSSLENRKWEKSMTDEAELLSRVENNVFWFLMLIFPVLYASHLALMYSHFCCMVENRTQKKVWFTSTFIINHTKTYLWWTGERLN